MDLTSFTTCCFKPKNAHKSHDNGRQRHNRLNYIATQRRLEQELNPRPLNCKSTFVPSNQLIAPFTTGIKINGMTTTYVKAAYCQLAVCHKYYHNKYQQRAVLHPTGRHSFLSNITSFTLVTQLFLYICFICYLAISLPIHTYIAMHVIPTVSSVQQYKPATLLLCMHTLNIPC